MQKSTNDRRYHKAFKNLLGYFKRKSALLRVCGTIGGNKDDVIELDGRKMTWEEFNYLFPDLELLPENNTPDTRPV